MSKLPRRLNRTVVYESQWVSLYVDQVAYSDGRMIPRHHVVHFDYPSAGVVILNDKNEVLLIRASRYTTQFTGWEIPAGGAEPGETPAAAAIREVREETGYEISGLELLIKETPLNGISDKQHYIYKARAAEKGDPLTPEEVDGMKWFTLPEAKALIQTGQIQCEMTLIGLLMILSST